MSRSRGSKRSTNEKKQEDRHDLVASDYNTGFSVTNIRDALCTSGALTSQGNKYIHSFKPLVCSTNQSETRAVLHLLCTYIKRRRAWDSSQILQKLKNETADGLL